MTGVKRFDWRDCIGQYALYYWVRSHHVIAIVLCVLHALAGIVTAAIFADTASVLDDAAAKTDANGNNTAASLAVFEGKFPASYSRYVASTSVVNILVASVLLFTVSGFILFFPACIVMFRRVERRLDGILREMDHRPDYVNVLLPYEFSNNADDGERSQVKKSHVTRRTSHVTRHTSHLTPHTSHLTPHTSHLTPHTSHKHLTPHTSLLTPHSSNLTPHTSHHTLFTSHFAPHTSHLIT